MSWYSSSSLSSLFPSACPVEEVDGVADGPTVFVLGIVCVARVVLFESPYPPTAPLDDGTTLLEVVWVEVGAASP